MSLLDYRTSRLTKLVVTKKRAGTSSGSELCDMDYTVIEMKRQVSDAGNPLQFMWVSLTASIIRVMGEFRYSPSGHTGLGAGATS